jgi:Xaa-Pro aminopeptidase
MDSSLEENGLESGLLTYIHGIGIEVRDAPVASNWDKKSGQEPGGINRVDHVLEPGMVLNIEAPLPIFHHGCYQVEYSLIVTEKGFEPLIGQQRQLFELPL